MLQAKAWIPRSDFVSIFGDLPSIAQVNRELLASLEASEDRVGAVFLELAPYLKFYSTYAQEFQAGSRLVERWTEKHRGFASFVSAQESRPEVALKLNALLITPVQRIPRYRMLLEDVIKNTPACHPDGGALREALKEIDAVAWHINEQLREHENGLLILDIQQSLQGKFPKVVAPGRRLVRQGVLMKVPRAGGHANPRYFVLFSDMLMYCKIKGLASTPGFKLTLPKANALECGCLLPLKHLKVETLVGKGVFKVVCQKEELILYATEAGESELWVDLIERTAAQLRKDAATLRKESSKREPIKRPEILKMRRESLSQIMLNNTKKKMQQQQETKTASPQQSRLVPRRLPFSSPRKKRPVSTVDEDGETSVLSSPKKQSRHATPTTTPVKQSKENRTPNSARKKMMAPPPPPPKADASKPSTSSSVRMRQKKVNRPAWKTLSLSRKDKLKEEESTSKTSLFRSPSIYDSDEEEEVKDDTVMTTYLSGKICPLTPSQRQTDISHLVTQELKDRLSSPERTRYEEDEDMNCRALVPASHFDRREEGSKAYCVLM